MIADKRAPCPSVYVSAEHRYECELLEGHDEPHTCTDCEDDVFYEAEWGTLQGVISQLRIEGKFVV